MEMQMEAMAIEMPPIGRHPNRMPFEGVLTIVDAASDKPPSGARGHRVLLTAEAVERAVPSLLGMALDFAPSLDRHDARRKVGIITSADVEQKSGVRRLAVSGYVFAQDFPELVREMTAGAERLGMSYEIADARVVDVHAPVWVVNEFTFTGAAVLLKDKAAYRETSIRLTSQRSGKS
jgi:hypothetical protein